MAAIGTLRIRRYQQFFFSYCRVCSSKLSSLCRPMQSTKAYREPMQESNSTLLGKCMNFCRSLDFIRTKVAPRYVPSSVKRIKKHGFEKRLSSKSQREILCRRFVKGRWTLSTFDRLTNQFPDTRPKSKRVQLMSRQHGYRSKMEKPEYFQFLT